MNRSQLKQLDWQQLFVSSYEKLPVQTINRLAAVVLVIAIAWLAARLTWLIWPQNNAVLEVPVAVEVPAQTSLSIERGNSANLFGRFQPVSTAAVAAPEPVVTDAPETNLNLTLTGVVATQSKPEQGTAIIEHQGVEQVYAVDEAIEGTSAVLKQVLIDRVLLQVSGRFETLMLDGIEYQQLSEYNAAISEGSEPQFADASEEQPSAIAPAPIGIADMRVEMLAEPAKFFDFIRVAPKYRNGQIYGYGLAPGKDPELFARLGLMPNDVAIEMNGVLLNDMQQAARVMQELAEAKEVSIKVERDGMIKDVQVNLSQQ